MTMTTHQARAIAPAGRPPRLGGLFWRLARGTSGAIRPLAGKRWNPVFALVETRGRKSGRTYSTPVAARRVTDGFVVALAFGAHVDWYRNLLAAEGGAIRWMGHSYPVGAPEAIDAEAALATFLPIQRVLVRAAGIDGYIFLRDREAQAS
jgi:deazaflavin-dependent oxidoreductase (nitroreductase family)